MDKVLSKEETLQKELITNFMRVSNALPYIHKAMDEYAKYQSIAFAEWSSEEGWEKHIGENTWRNRQGYATEYTTKQLYALFTIHKERLKEKPELMPEIKRTP